MRVVIEKLDNLNTRIGDKSIRDILQLPELSVWKFSYPDEPGVITSKLLLSSTERVVIHQIDEDPYETIETLYILI